VEKSKIREKAAIYLRDAGAARHWRNEVLDEWLALAFDEELVQRGIASNESYWTHTELITTDTSGQFDLEPPANLAKAFNKPMGLVKKTSLTDAGGIPYVPDSPRNHLVVWPAGTYSIARKILQVNPRQVETFAFMYSYTPEPWLELDEGEEPDFPSQFHRLIALHGAIMALGEGGRDTPGWLGKIASELMERFEGWLGRFNEEGPIVCKTADNAWSWGST
jgi:hypothetical protein